MNINTEFIKNNGIKILIIGHNGWIGGMAIKLLQENNISYITTDIRPQHKQLFEEEILKLQPTHIIAFIGRTTGEINNKIYNTIDYLEQPGTLSVNIRDNLFSPLVIALLCKKYNIHYTYIGTGCIFNYDDTHPYNDETTGYSEDAVPNFTGSNYSIVKGYSDELMHLFEDTVLNVRIRMPITCKNEPRNFITKIINYEKICSIPNSMTVLDELLPYIIDMAVHKHTGTINMTNPGLITHNEILEMYKKYVDNEYEWRNFTIEEQNKILDAQRSNNCLDSHKLTTLYPQIKNIHDSIKDVMQHFNNIF